MTARAPVDPIAPVALVVDDDRDMRLSLLHLLKVGGWEAHALPGAAGVRGRIAALDPDVLVSDVRMPGMDGLTLLRSLKPLNGPPVILISAHGDIPMAVAAMRDGAYSFVEKPFDPEALLRLMTQAMDHHRLTREAGRLRARLGVVGGLERLFVGQAATVAALRADIVDLADTAAPVLLIGETGTGKELVARALHDLGPQAGRPFVAVNCATLRADRIEGIMLGTATEPGILDRARGGTLFLDEVPDWPEDARAILLRALEGGGDFRIVSAAAPAIEAAVEGGLFRKDLFYRLSTMILRLPALRDRRDDILLLYRHFSDEYAALYTVQPPPMTVDDMGVLMAHDWPGNVRELRNVAERRVLAARRGGGTVAQALMRDGGDPAIPDTLREAVAAFERELVARAITAHGGRMDAVAEALGIGRRTLNDKIVKLGLDKDALL